MRPSTGLGGAWPVRIDDGQAVPAATGVLPVPRRCSRGGESGVRLFFDKGTIKEVTAWQPSRMEFEITGDTLPGNQWPAFSKAGYELTGEAGQIRVTRHTTIESRLWPLVLGFDRATRRPLRARVRAAIARQKLRLTKRDGYSHGSAIGSKLCRFTPRRGRRRFHRGSATAAGVSRHRAVHEAHQQMAQVQLRQPR